jgi:NitT/TauT family transport system ATP-binding protein
VFLSDRVVVMTPRPGRIREILPIELPRPRGLDLRDSPEFGRYTRHIGQLFRELGVISEQGAQHAH